MKWEPIETAPKDGVSILTYPHYRVTSWDSYLGGFSKWSCREDAAILLRPPATHWMPLPPPPEAP